MHLIHQEDRFYTFNFRKGEEVMAGLLSFVKEKNIKAAHITGLGAASALILAYYNLETKQYEKHDIAEDVEILSLTGNIGIKENGDSVIHLHGVFGKKDLSTFGGHIFSMTISGAGEIQLAKFEGAINRAYDADTGLTLMCPAQ